MTAPAAARNVPRRSTARLNAWSVHEQMHIFDFDWFHGRHFEEQKHEAKRRCSSRRFPDLSCQEASENAECVEFVEKLRVRTLVYLRDGFSYELKDLAKVTSTSHLTFECEPVDDQYKVGSFVVSVPFEEIVRVEVFAVPPGEMPEDAPAITGFRTRSESHPPPP